MRSGALLDTSLITGWLPAALTVAGLAALAALIALPPRRRWWARAAAVLIGCAVLVALADLYLGAVWKPFPDALPPAVLGWGWLALSAAALAVARLIGARGRGRVAALLAGLLAVTGGCAQINRYYGQYPTVGVALGITTPVLTDLPAAAGPAGPLVTAPPGGYLGDSWVPPPGLPAAGTVSKIDIPPTASGFHARSGYLYLPPAYQARPRPALPVLVLMAGQPGTPDAWLVSGQVDTMLDDYARAHGGLAPIVVMVDNLGSTFANPLCTDSPRGNVETYLTRDVPDWVHAHLQTATGPDSRVSGGLSSGGTCALQLALRAPQVYGRFIDISGEREPISGDRRRTLDQVFGGSEAAYAAVSPLQIMARHRFPDTAGRIVAGADDRTYRPQQLQILAAGRAAGMDLSYLELPGGHSWQVWAPGLAQSLPWLAHHTRLVR